MTWDISVQNIGGILEGEASIEPGANAVRGANWQGKSSFVQAIETALGTETALTDGRDSGWVTLETPDGEYRVELRRTNGTVSRIDTPYLDTEYDRVRADLYAFLDEKNLIRAAVRRGDDLEEYLTRPLELENIDEQIKRKKSERSQVKSELETAEEAANEIVSVEKRISSLENELDELEAEREQISDSEPQEENQETLSDLRAERDQQQQNIDRLENTLERATERLSERRSELDELTVPDNQDFESELAELRSEMQSAEHDIDIVQDIYSANKRLLDEDRIELLADVEHGLAEDTITCWVCDSQTTKSDIEDRLEALHRRLSELQQDVKEYRTRFEDLEERRDELRTKRRRRSDLQDEIADLEETISDREQSLENARSRLEELEERIEEVSESVSERDERLTDIESNIKYNRRELEEAHEKKETLERRAGRREMLCEERDQLTQEIRDLRNRKQEMKRRTREEFEAAAADIIERFDTSYDAARLTSEFELVIARDGREISIDALSESEIELLGIVAALAGYEAFDVHDDVPVILADGLGSLDEDNLETLVDLLAERADYLVFTSYPEHDLTDSHVIDPAEWTIVSSQDSTAST